MSDSPAHECEAKYNSALPPQGLDESLPISAYKKFLQAIDEDTRSTLFISSGDAYTKFAKELDDNDQDEGDTVFPSGVKAHVRQYNGFPNLLILEEPDTGRKETVNLNERSGVIEGDKVEFCGVSRERHFKSGGETYRAYGFPGGIIETDDSGHPHLEKK